MPKGWSLLRKIQQDVKVQLISPGGHGRECVGEIFEGLCTAYLSLQLKQASKQEQWDTCNGMLSTISLEAACTLQHVLPGT